MSLKLKNIKLKSLPNKQTKPYHPPQKKSPQKIQRVWKETELPTQSENSSLFGFSLHVCKPSKELGVALGCRRKSAESPWDNPTLVSVNCYLLVVEPTHLKNMSKIGNHPQVGMKIKNLWVATS